LGVIKVVAPFEMASKCTKGAENVCAPLVMVSIKVREMTLTDKTVYQNGSIDSSLDSILFSLDGIFRGKRP
jgi:hypothetical protein